MTEKPMPAWQRILVARAQGKDVDPADLAEAQAAARPGTVGWAARVAARAEPVRRSAPEGQDRFRAAIRARLGRDSSDGGPSAA